MTNFKFAIVVPTKNRIINLKNLINSLCESTLKPEVMIIVDSSDVIEKLDFFNININIKHETPNIVGQVKQRNYGINKIIEGYNVEYILCLDDDICLHDNTLSELFKGVLKYTDQDKLFVAFSLNLINMKPAKSFSRRILMYSKNPGTVLKSAFNSSLSSVDSDSESDWALGGATLWSKHFLAKNVNDYPFSGKAYAEDLYFSSKIRSKARFSVISNARCLHNDYYEMNYPRSFLYSFYEGSKDSQVRFFIANNFPQYSLFFSIFHSLWIAFVGFIGGILLLNIQIFFLSIGRIWGTIVMCFKYKFYFK